MDNKNSDNEIVIDSKVSEETIGMDKKILDDEKNMDNANNSDEKIIVEDLDQEKEKSNDGNKLKNDGVTKVEVISEDKEVTTSNKIIVAVAYICAIFIPLIGFIFGLVLIYLKEPPIYNKHGGYVVLVALIVWILSALMNSL